MINNMHSKQCEYMLKQLMAYDFVQFELNLYLDTHPHDQKALKEFQRIRKIAEELRKKYEAEFGPITASAIDCENEWTWINSPWPWEN